jgi:hypothetical protein
MLLRYFVIDFEMAPVVPISTCITFVFTFHLHCISVVLLFFFNFYYYYLYNLEPG